MAKTKKYYAVCVIDITVEVIVLSQMKQSLPLSWSDGQIGAIAVFSNKKKAEKYAKTYKSNPKVIVFEAFADKKNTTFMDY